MHADNVATANVSQQGADSRQLRADRDIDLAALYQIHIRRVVDDGHHFACAEAFGQQRGHDIGLVIVGQRQEQIDFGDVFFQQ